MIAIMSKDFVEQLITTSTRQRTLSQGNYLFHQGDTVRSVFVVSKGQIELARHAENGTSLVLQRATGNTLLAEASVYSRIYHCDAIALLPSTVFEIPKANFEEIIHQDSTIYNAWAAHLAREIQSARYRCELMSRKTVADRLDAWMAWPGNKLPPRGQWKSIANEIDVSPEALYRELSKRRSSPMK